MGAGWARKGQPGQQWTLGQRQHVRLCVSRERGLCLSAQGGKEENLRAAGAPLEI